MTDPVLRGDRAWCEATLPRVSRTFALNIRLLAGPLREAVGVGYLLCRTADTLEDAWPGTAAEIEDRFGLFLAAVGGDGSAAAALAAAAAGYLRQERVAWPGAAELEAVAGFPHAWRAWWALPAADRDRIADCLRVMAPGMRRYAARAAGRPAGVPYLDSEAELHDYCWTVAGCVGVMLTRLAEAGIGGGEATRARRLELAPVVGEALQLTNILLDWPADVRQGRCYLPADWLAGQGLAPAALVGADGPGVRAVAARLEALARAALEHVPDYLALVPASRVRFRQFCLWPALWARASLRHAKRDPRFPWGPRRPRLPRAELWTVALRSLAVGHSAAGVRALFGG